MTGMLGPEGVQHRMEQLQARIDAFTPKPPPAPAPMPGQPSFGSTLKGLLPADPSSMTVQPFNDLAAAAANKYGVDPKIFKSLVNTESGWNPQSVSNKGAQGLTQLMPDTAAAMGVNDPMDPAQNLDGGAKYLRQMLDKFGNDYTKALAAYNAGPGAVERANGVPPYQETIAYVRKIMGGAGR